MSKTVKYTLEARMRLLISHALDSKPQWTKMEEITSVKAIKWRQFMAKLKGPTLEMLEALCRTFPNYSFWLVTGLSDEDAGHVAPPGHSFPRTQAWDENEYMQEYEATNNYFHQSLSSLSEVTREHVLYLQESNLDDDESSASDWFSTVLGTDEFTVIEKLQIMQKLARLQHSHLDQMLLRIRMNNSDADSIINAQRAREKKTERELTNLIKRKDGDQKKSG